MKTNFRSELILQETHPGFRPDGNTIAPLYPSYYRERIAPGKFRAFTEIKFFRVEVIGYELNIEKILFEHIQYHMEMMERIYEEYAATEDNSMTNKLEGGLQ